MNKGKKIEHKVKKNKVIKGPKITRRNKRVDIYWNEYIFHYEIFTSCHHKSRCNVGPCINIFSLTLCESRRFSHFHRWRKQTQHILDLQFGLHNLLLFSAKLFAWAKIKFWAKALDEEKSGIFFLMQLKF